MAILCRNRESLAFVGPIRREAIPLKYTPRAADNTPGHARSKGSTRSESLFYYFHLKDQVGPTDHAVHADTQCCGSHKEFTVPPGAFHLPAREQQLPLSCGSTIELRRLRAALPNV